MNGASLLSFLVLHICYHCFRNVFFLRERMTDISFKIEERLGTNLSTHY